MTLTDDTDITFEDVILETMPFAEELIVWCKNHPEFKDALKIAHPDRFVHIGTAMITRPRSSPNDEVIGVYAYDYQLQDPKFKQDFIVNLNKEYKEFLLFTRNPKGSSKWVKDIKEFYSTYGKDGDYVHSHYVTFDQLPEKAKPFAIRAMKMGNDFKKNDFVKPTKEIIKKMYQSILAEKNRLGIKKTLTQKVD